MNKPSPSRQVQVHWRLRMAAAEAGIYSASALFEALRPHGLKIKESQVRRVFSGQPERLNLALLALLCQYLRVEPGDLLVLVDQAKSERLKSVPAPKTKSAHPPQTARENDRLVGPPVPAMPRGVWNER